MEISVLYSLWSIADLFCSLLFHNLEIIGVVFPCPPILPTCLGRCLTKTWDFSWEIIPQPPQKYQKYK